MRRRRWTLRKAGSQGLGDMRGGESMVDMRGTGAGIRTMDIEAAEEGAEEVMAKDVNLVGMKNTAGVIEGMKVAEVVEVAEAVVSFMAMESLAIVDGWVRLRVKTRWTGHEWDELRSYGWTEHVSHRKVLDLPQRVS
jgi:hypothetical protein